MSAVLALDRVSYSYGATRAVDGLTLAVGAGEVVALSGPPGAGKTTALHLGGGYLEPVEGRRILRSGSRAWALMWAAQDETALPLYEVALPDDVAAGDLVHGDELTLHGRTSGVLATLGRLAARGAACLIAGHDPAVMRAANRLVTMRDGRAAACSYVPPANVTGDVASDYWRSFGVECRGRTFSVGLWTTPVQRLSDAMLVAVPSTTYAAALAAWGLTTTEGASST